MPSIREAVLSSWTFEPWPCALAAATLLVYGRGWLDLHRQMPNRFPLWRLVAFAGGVLSVMAALASPLDTFAGLLLQVHMIQHLLLMVVAPALIWLGAPATPLLRGIPTGLAKHGLGPFLASSGVRDLANAVAHPAVCWIAAAAATWIWHLPGPYQLALRSSSWHAVEHACFFASGLLFWFPVVQPWPSIARWPRWSMVPYLLLADLQNTALAAFLTFADRVIYPIYATVPRLNGITPLNDQIAAGAIMWVPMSLAYLVPAGVITMRLLSPDLRSAPLPIAERMVAGRAATKSRLDLLAIPVVGTVVRSLTFRRTAQTLLLLIALAVIVDGLLGPTMSPMNLAGVLPWTHWRGVTVIALLAVGNLFCMACPFMLPRELGRRLALARWSWPRRLRSKWLAVGVLLLFVWGYEALGIWDWPAATALLIVGLFVGAFTVDTFFRGASFCKYVCPIGQFHFVQSLVSPFEVAIRRPSACESCTTHDCVRGNPTHRGCELDLFLPRKVSNLDCTFCLDCVRACPQDNIGILATVPAATLLDDRERASLGRLSRRPDIGALAALLVFGAFASAAVMNAPVASALESLRTRLGLESMHIVATLWTAGAFVIVPALAIAVATAISGRLGRASTPLSGLAIRFSLALVPLGAMMWAAHFLFHFLSGWRSAIPVVQRAADSLGLTSLGAPEWSLACPVATHTLLSVELLLLDLGLLVTLYTAWRIARGSVPSLSQSLRVFSPWATLALLLYLSGVWTFFQPMQMRGLMVH